MDNEIIKIDDVIKEYRLGQIGGGTLKGDLQSWWAKVRGKEDPNAIIGQEQKGKKGELFRALNGVSFSVKKGERIGLIGHNGAGKSTLLKLISRVTTPTYGKIEYQGRIASMLEVGTGFHPELTGRENIYLNGAILGMTKEEIASKIDAIVEFAEIEQFIDTPIKRYSSGMKVKLGFSVAAHLDAEIMIMDEVLAVGDMAFQNKCIAKMNELSKDEGRTILYVSHNMNTIRTLCNKCIVLNKGLVEYNGTVEKGIQKYLARSREPDMPLSSMERSWAANRYIQMLDIKIDNPLIQLGDALCFQLKWRGNKKCENVKFRMILRSQDDQPVGLAFTDNLGNIGENEVRLDKFKFSTKNLSVGTYVLSIAMYQCDSNKNSIILDHISRAISFEIEDIYNKSQIVWESQYWGYVQLEPIQYLGKIK